MTTTEERIFAERTMKSRHDATIAGSWRNVGGDQEATFIAGRRTYRAVLDTGTMIIYRAVSATTIPADLTSSTAGKE